ncbi:multidrug effflux MFS transporter [Paracoccus sp. (in: a-proteobacteria)]|uniref:multidrug effflux MFS transporter n=1 Tax=Paracoccus sp. TaxID=267 RepID=UPI0028A1F52A|nr:multidrug effflux MFS transporter [Paracoccus sp. (in: a-proteobacteria)]
MTGARTPPHIATLVLLSGVAALSMNVFLPSLPGMALHFGVDYATMQLSVSAYLGVGALMQLAAGPVSDLFGRRVVMLAALMIFLAATLGTLLAPTAGWFLFYRLIQAVITSAFVISRAMVRDMVPGEQAASLLGYVTMGMSIVPMLAPVLGGLLDEAFGWQATFMLMAAAGIAVFLLCWFDLGETARGTGTPLRSQIATYPALANSRLFWGYAATITLGSGSFFAYLGGAPFVGSTVFHLTSAQVGYWFAAPSIGYALGNFLSGRYARIFGMKRLMLAGVWVSTVALSLALAADLAGLHQPLIFFGAVAFLGLGNGLLLPSANAGMMSVRPELAGTAAGLGGALSVAGGAMLAALAGALLHDESGAFPLLAVMLASAIAAVIITIATIRASRLV